MNHTLIIRASIIVIAAVIVLIIGILSWSFLNQEDKYAITEETITQNDRVSVDFSHYPDVFTSAQQAEIQANLLTRSAKEVSEDTKIKGTIRESSLVRSTEGEVLLIIDSSELQTSYLISRFTDPGENLDILNITCVDESLKIYKQDYCRAE